MEEKSRSVQSKNFIQAFQNQPKSFQSLNTLAKFQEVTIYEVLRDTKGKKELGRYYRCEKTFYYKQRFMAVYLMNVLFRENGQSVKVQKPQKAIQRIFMTTLKELGKGYIDGKVSLEEKKKVQRRISKLINFLGNMFEKSISQRECVNSEDINFLIEILISRWVNGDEKEQKLAHDIKFVYGRQLKMAPILRQHKITQLLISPLDKPLCQEKHLLYKQFQFSISNSEIISIIETNQQPHVYFKLSFPIFPLPKSRISELFHQKDRYSVLQSEDDNNESDSNSQIVKDDQFYRISSRILSSVRKNSFNSGTDLLEEHLESKKRWFMADGILMDDKICPKKDCGCNCLDPCAIIEHKPANPSSEMYTRSSSLQKSKFTRKENMLSTSIDLLMRVEIQAENKRQKSCQTARTYLNKETQMSIQYPLIVKSSFKSNEESQLKINLLNEDHASLFSGNFEIQEREQIQTNKNLINKRFLIARSLFRQS